MYIYRVRAASCWICFLSWWPFLWIPSFENLVHFRRCFDIHSLLFLLCNSDLGFVFILVGFSQSKPCRKLDVPFPSIPRRLGLAFVGLVCSRPWSSSILPAAWRSRSTVVSTVWRVSYVSSVLLAILFANL
jgi:hypothetical protein